MSAPRSGSSFALAARLLPADVREDALALYSFCRQVDDLADLSTDRDAARRELEVVRRALLAEPAPEAVGGVPVGTIRRLAARRGVPLEPLVDLVDTVAGDLGPVRIATRADLLDYCYGVAGTVGVAMAAVLGVRSMAALHPAIDLGIAMQLCNIARDVVDDAARDRLYLPLDALGDGVTPQRLLAGDPAARAAAWDATRGLLALADELYRRADRGLPAIPLRSRPAIVLAARGYEEIGRELLRGGGDAAWRRPVRPRRGQFAARALTGIVASLVGRTGGPRPASGGRPEPAKLP
ncbi:MAG: phytoene/squalene synthase family protein [Acidobacteriota bacterium]